MNLYLMATYHFDNGTSGHQLLIDMRLVYAPAVSGGAVAETGDSPAAEPCAHAPSRRQRYGF